MCSLANSSELRVWNTQDWVTVAVTALPSGWRNVWGGADGRLIMPCPALLIQELRQTVYSREVLAPEGAINPIKVEQRVTLQMPPYETRVVFASHESGYLCAALDESNYLGAVGPGEDVYDQYPVNTNLV